MSHHYGESATHILMKKRNMVILFRNHETGAKIKLSIPLKGAGHTSRSRTTRMLGQRLADEIAHVLRQVLE